VTSQAGPEPPCVANSLNSFGPNNLSANVRNCFQARIARLGAGDVDAVVLSNTNPSQTAKAIETTAANSRAGGMTNDAIPITARMIAR
jgi:hypothetical protein